MADSSPLRTPPPTSHGAHADVGAAEEDANSSGDGVAAADSADGTNTEPNLEDSSSPEQSPEGETSPSSAAVRHGPRIQPTPNVRARDQPLADDVTIEELDADRAVLNTSSGGNANGGASTRKQYDTARTKYFESFVSGGGGYRIESVPYRSGRIGSRSNLYAVPDRIEYVRCTGTYAVRTNV